METPPQDLRTRLWNAIEGDDTEAAIDCLRRGLDPDVCFDTWRGERTLPAVSLCIKRGRVAIMEALLRSGCNINQRDSDGMTPLHYGADGGNVEMAALLLSKQAEVNWRDTCGDTPLHSAALKSRLGVVKMLVEAGADVNAYNEMLWTPLHTACTLSSSWPFASYLLSKGAMVNARDAKGKTPLLAAACLSRLSLKMLSGLLEAGSDVNCRNDEGQNVLHVLLINKYPYPQEHTANLIELILSTPYRCDVNATTAQGRTPLHLAVLCSSFRFVRIFIRAGCLVEWEDDKNITPVGYALKHQNYHLIELLTAAGVVIPRQEWIKLQESLKDDPERLKGLLEVGADFPKLSNLCRRAFYEYFGAEARTRVENLPLCPMIKRYLAFDIL